MICVQGFAELEYGMLRYMGAIDDSTPVVTTGMYTNLELFCKTFSCLLLFIFMAQEAFTSFPVHDCQLVDDIPIEKLAIHDVPVDIICTPTRVIFTNTPIPKPQGLDKTLPDSVSVHCS